MPSSKNSNSTREEPAEDLLLSPEEIPDSRSNFERPLKVVWDLAWPAIALNSLQVVNSVLDRTFIGHLPKSALVAHGGVTSVMFLMFSLAVAVATAAGAIVSRAYGANQPSEYRMASDQVLRVAFYSGLLIGGLAFASAPWIANFILPQSSPDAIRLMTQFAMVYSLGLPAIFLIQTIAASLRGIGDTKSPMRISGLQILLHIALNYVLIFPQTKLGSISLPGAGLGLLGAAIALSTSAWVAAIIYLVFVQKTKLATQFTLAFPKLDWMKRIPNIAIPAGFMAFLRVFSLTVFTMILGLVPEREDAIAAMTTSFAIESLIFAPAFGLSAAAAALVGQSLGAKNPDRAEKLGWVCAGFATVIGVVMSAPVYILAEPIARLMLGNNEGVIKEVIVLIHWLCITEPLFCVAMVLIGALQGAGDTKRPMFISLIALWGLRVPMAVILCMPSGALLLWGLHTPIGMGLGALGAWIAMSVTQGVQGVMSILAFRQGHWKEKEV